MPGLFRHPMLRAALCAATLLVAPLAHAADPDRARARFEADNGRKWIEGYVQAFAAPWAPTDDADRLAEAAARHFDADEIFDEVAARIAAALSDDQLQVLVDWHATPLGARMLAAENAFEPSDCDDPGAACHEALARMEIFQDPRLPHLRAVAALQNFGGFALAIRNAIQRAAWQAGVAAGPDGPLTQDRIDRVIRRYTEDNADAFARESLSHTAEAFAPFTPEDIAAYADFLATDAAQIYLLSAGGALSRALSTRTGNLAREVVAQGPTKDL